MGVTFLVLWHSKRMGRVVAMADRKQFQNVPNPDPELMRLLNETSARPVSEEELREQRISFAFGNAPADAQTITKESVRRASLNIKLSS